MGVGSGCINSQQESCLVWVWGAALKSARWPIALDGVACAARRFSLLRPRLPASGDGGDPSDVTTCLSLGFGVGSGLGHGSWPGFVNRSPGAARREQRGL